MQMNPQPRQRYREETRREEVRREEVRPQGSWETYPPSKPSQTRGVLLSNVAEENERAARLKHRESAERLQREKEETRRKLEGYKSELNSMFDQTLHDEGYLPPEPLPLLRARALEIVAHRVKTRTDSDSDFSEALRSLQYKFEQQYGPSRKYLENLKSNLEASTSILQKFKLLFTGAHSSISQATISLEMPNVTPPLDEKMAEIEHFLATDWATETHRGVLSIHVDKVRQSTVLQIGVAAHGPIYITIPALLRPEERALKSLRAMLKQLAAFSNVVDPLAVINGQHHGLNYNRLLPNSRVIRAPSGNTSRLAQNLRETAQRERLSADNTTIINSTPSSSEEYARVFEKDREARGWPAWENEAQLWDGTVAENRFTRSQEASQEALVTALTRSKNVIVIVAHCDGESIFMPAPPPEGSEVDADYLLAHRDQIAANAPFVYLFSCEAGKVSDLRGFASTLLECGASGVIASQSEVGSAEGRVLLGRLLNEERGAPPIEDYFNAMRDVNFRDMEVFLA